MSDEEVKATESSEEAPKPRRGRPRKAAASKEVAPAPEATTAEEAPKPKRTRAKKPAAESAPVEEASSTEEAPKPRTRRTKKTAEEAESSEVKASKMAAGDQEEAKPKAKASRSRVKKTAEDTKETSEGSVESSDAKASAASAETASDEPASTPSRTTRQRRTRKTDTEEGSAKESSPAQDAGEGAAKEAAANGSDAVGAGEESGSEEGSRSPRRERDGQERTGKASGQDRSQRSFRQQERSNQGRGRNQRQDQRSRGNQGSNHHQQRRQHNREIQPSVTKEELAALKVSELRERAEALELEVAGLKKAELVEQVFDATMKAEGFKEVTGVLDIVNDGSGYLRAEGYLPGDGDAFISANNIRRNGLRKGDLVTGQTRPGNNGKPPIQKVISVNGIPLEEMKPRPRFSDLTPVYPDERLTMEHGRSTTTARVIDLVAPVGKGQRGLIVSPPKAGKTTILKDIAASIAANNPEVHLICLLVDERPEEVTDMQRSVRGEVVSSTFDMPATNHIAVAELVIERAKRLVEQGKDVVILLDSITRLARAYNLAQPASGRILSGGVDSTALYPPKRFLGAARNIEGGGSLTILASALIDTGSKMDEVIFEEFKGTGNMELKLDRSLADRRIFPAIDPVTSGTRKEDLLIDPQEAPLIWAVRRLLANMNNTERAMDMLIKSLNQTSNNEEFLMRTAKKAQSQHGKTDEGFEL